MSDRQNLPRPAPEVGYADADRQFLEAGLSDDEADTLAEFNPGFEDTLSAEEAAMGVVDEPPGMNDDSDPGYIDHNQG